MEGNLGGSEGRRSPVRAIAPWVLGLAGILLAMWGISSAIERMAVRPGMGGGEAGAKRPGATLPVGATVQVEVRVMDEDGKEFPLGSPLPRQLSLTMLGAEGQEFLVPFDRAGSWAVEAPDGAYTIPDGQKKMGNWRWKLSGKGVARAAKKTGWTAAVNKAVGPLVLELTLY